MLDPDVAADLMDIINESYTDGIDEIVSAETQDAPGFEGDDLFVVALDGQKRLGIRINETRPGKDQITIKLLKPNEIYPSASDYGESEQSELTDSEWDEIAEIDDVDIQDALNTMTQPDRSGEARKG